MSVAEIDDRLPLSEGLFTTSLAESDPDLMAALRAEKGRQQDQIELIASENIVSRAVLEAQGSVLTNKYAEGYSGRRYYGGCEFVDVAETLAIERACALFGCGFANVQPHSGAQANGAVMLALLQPGDTILGMSLAAGGHLTHGAAPALSGKWFNAIQYGVRREDALVDFDEVERLARKALLVQEEALLEEVRVEHQEGRLALVVEVADHDLAVRRDEADVVAPGDVVVPEDEGLLQVEVRELYLRVQHRGRVDDLLVEELAVRAAANERGRVLQAVVSVSEVLDYTIFYP